MIKQFSTLLAAATVALSAFAQSAAPNTDAEVKKIDKAASKVTLSHGEIKNLDMPPMTMVFVAKDKTMLDKVKVGDKIKVRIEKEGPTYVVTAFEAKP